MAVVARMATDAPPTRSDSGYTGAESKWRDVLAVVSEAAFDPMMSLLPGHSSGHSNAGRSGVAHRTGTRTLGPQSDAPSRLGMRGPYSRLPNVDLAARDVHLLVRESHLNGWCQQSANHRQAAQSEQAERPHRARQGALGRVMTALLKDGARPGHGEGT